MENQQNIIDPSSKIFKDVYMRDSRVGKAVIYDRAVLISADIADKVEIGRGTSVIHASFDYGSYVGSDSVIKWTKVGKYCNLSWHLSIGGSNHNYKAACMYTDSWWKRTFNVGAGLAPVKDGEYTTIGNDVWIGAKANIIRGVKIGDGTVVGANSLVLHDTPPYSIVVGSPAKVIKYRFEKEIISRLLAISWWNWDIDTIKEASEYLRGDLDESKLCALEAIANSKRNSP